jgi:hypothetical protein
MYVCMEIAIYITACEAMLAPWNHRHSEDLLTEGRVADNIHSCGSVMNSLYYYSLTAYEKCIQHVFIFSLMYGQMTLQLYKYRVSYSVYIPLC